MSVSPHPLGAAIVALVLAIAASATTSKTEMGASPRAVTNYLTYVHGKAGRANPKLSKVYIGWVNQQGGQVVIGGLATAGASMAVDYVNQHLGGIGGHPVQLVPCFIKSAEEEGTTCGQKFVNDKRISVVAEGAVATGAQSMHATIGSTKPIVTGVAITPVNGASKTGVVLFGDGPHILLPFGNYAKNVLHAKTAAVVYPNSPGVAESGQVIAAGLKAAGIATKQVGYTQGQTDDPQTRASGRSSDWHWPFIGRRRDTYGAVQNNIGGAKLWRAGNSELHGLKDGSHSNFNSYVNYGDLVGTYSPLGGSHVGEKVLLGNPLDVMAEVSFGPYWAAYVALTNHSLNTYAVNILGPETPTPVPFNIQKMMDDPFGTFGADGTSQFTVLSNGTLVTTYKAPDGTLLGNATQNADGTGSVSLFATSGQSWIKETGFFNAKGQLTSAKSQKTNGDTERTSFDTANNQSYYARTLTEDLNGALKTQADVLDSLDQYTKYYDIKNTHPYNELDVATDSTGKVTAAQAQLDQNIIAAGGSVGQIFGSALGRALAPNNQFAQLAIGHGRRPDRAEAGAELCGVADLGCEPLCRRRLRQRHRAGRRQCRPRRDCLVPHRRARHRVASHRFRRAVVQRRSRRISPAACSIRSRPVSPEAPRSMPPSARSTSAAAATQAGYNISAAFGSYLGA